MIDKIKQFGFYALRWQLSTPVYACVLYLLNDKFGYVLETMLANFIGACIFFWVDKFIFSRKKKDPPV